MMLWRMCCGRFGQRVRGKQAKARPGPVGVAQRLQMLLIPYGRGDGNTKGGECSSLLIGIEFRPKRQQFNQLIGQWDPRECDAWFRPCFPQASETRLGCILLKASNQFCGCWLFSCPDREPLRSQPTSKSSFQTPIAVSDLADKSTASKTTPWAVTVVVLLGRCRGMAVLLGRHRRVAE